MISESPNLLDPSGPGQACNGFFYMLFFVISFFVYGYVLFLLVEKFRGKLSISIIIYIYIYNYLYL